MPNAANGLRIGQVVSLENYHGIFGSSAPARTNRAMSSSPSSRMPSSGRIIGRPSPPSRLWRRPAGRTGKAITTRSASCSASPRGAAYPVGGAILDKRFADAPLARSSLAVDITGVGRPVLDLLRKARIFRATIRPITVTGGHEAHSDENGGWLVPRKELVSTLQVPLQQRRLRVGETLPEVPTLVQELLNFASNGLIAPGDAPTRPPDAADFGNLPIGRGIAQSARKTCHQASQLGRWLPSPKSKS
jgi:hypothetical protein